VDPFDCLAVETLVTGAPLLKRSPVVFDCLVIRHLDLEADHSLYIAHVMGGKVNDAALLERIRHNGSAA
jgi:flavin reductase (DIM6/NTAB) family NADH-FMN oxidoreductase RutF